VAASLVNLKGHEAQILDVAFSADGRRVASASTDIRVWETGSDQVLTPFICEHPRQHTSTFLSVALSPSGPYLAGGDALGQVLIWDVRESQSNDRQRLRRFEGRARLSRSITGGGRPTPATERQVQEKASIRALAYSRDGRFLAAGDKAGQIVVYDTANRVMASAGNGAVHAFFQDSTDPVRCLVFLGPSHTLVATGARGRGLIIWDVASQRMQKMIPYEDSILGLAASLDGRQVAFTSGNLMMVLHPADPNNHVAQRIVSDKGFTGVAFSPDGRSLATTEFEDSSIRLWDVATGKETRAIDVGERLHFRIAWSPDGKVLATIGGNEARDLILVYPDSHARTVASPSAPGATAPDGLPGGEAPPEMSQTPVLAVATRTVGLCKDRNMGSRIREWPAGTRFEILGPEQENWRRVRDPEGREGWIPRKWVDIVLDGTLTGHQATDVKPIVPVSTPPAGAIAGMASAAQHETRARQGTHRGPHGENADMITRFLGGLQKKAEDFNRYSIKMGIAGRGLLDTHARGVEDVMRRGTDLHTFLLRFAETLPEGTRYDGRSRTILLPGGIALTVDSKLVRDDQPLDSEQVAEVEAALRAYAQGR
jgi:WD40 repeat protein